MYQIRVYKRCGNEVQKITWFDCESVDEFINSLRFEPMRDGWYISNSYANKGAKSRCEIYCKIEEIKRAV